MMVPIPAIIFAKRVTHRIVRCRYGMDDTLFQERLECSIDGHPVKLLPGFSLDDPKNNAHNINEQFLHTQFFALVDKNGNVRKKIYDGLVKEEIEEL